MFLLFGMIFYTIIPTILGGMSHNVPAVYDVFATRIRACVAKTRAAKMWVE
jgi:hypothetical protein